MIIFVIIFYVMICYGNQFYNLPPTPCTFTITTVYKINCCTFLFNMSYSRIALKNYTVITIKRNEKLHCTNNKKFKISNFKYMVVVPKRLNSLNLLDLHDVIHD